MSTKKSVKETDKVLADYRKRNANRKLSAEEQYEMSAAFGPGQTVVDIITGQRFKTR